MILKRSVTIRGHSTSISIEERFWQRLRAIADERSMPLARLIAEIDAGRDPRTNLSSALRLFVLDHALAFEGERQPPGAGGTGVGPPTPGKDR